MTPSSPAPQDLAPCPFCGSAATLKRGKTTMVSCTSCTASTFQVLSDSKSAIAAWNRRAGSSTSTSQAAAPGDALDAARLDFIDSWVQKCKAAGHVAATFTLDTKSTGREQIDAEIAAIAASTAQEKKP